MHVRRPATAIAVVVSLGLGVVGCGGDPPEAKPAPSTSAAAPSPTPTGPVAPELPADAKREDEVGAKAFIKFWFSVVTYAMQTGDTSAMDQYAADQCETCIKLSKSIETAYADGGHLEGAGWSVEGVRAGSERSDGVQLYLFAQQAPQAYVDRSGRVSKRIKGAGFGAEALVIRQDDWVLRELALL